MVSLAKTRFAAPFSTGSAQKPPDSLPISPMKRRWMPRWTRLPITWKRIAIARGLLTIARNGV